MGYYARYTGRIDIDPPLPWRVIKGSPALPGRTSDSDVELILNVDEVETDEGVVIRRSAIAVRPTILDSFKGYAMTTHLQAVIDLASDNAVTTFTGRIDALGEDGDRWRIKVVDGRAREFRPTLSWPPESE